MQVEWKTKAFQFMLSANIFEAPYEIERLYQLHLRLAPVSNVIFCSKTDNLSKTVIYKLYLEYFLAWTSLNLTIREDRILIR